MTTELERIKALEAKIAHVIEHIHRLTSENERLKGQVKDLKAEKKDMDELAKRSAKLDEDLKRYDNEREVMRGKIEALIAQIDKLGL